MSPGLECNLHPESPHFPTPRQCTTVAASDQELVNSAFVRIQATQLPSERQPAGEEELNNFYTVCRVCFQEAKSTATTWPNRVAEPEDLAKAKPQDFRDVLSSPGSQSSHTCERK